MLLIQEDESSGSRNVVNPMDFLFVVHCIDVSMYLWFVLWSIWISSVILIQLQAGSRKLLLDVVSVIWNDTSALMRSSTAARSPLLRKYLIKLSQRIGLICLPHRSPSWRYVVRSFELWALYDSDAYCFNDMLCILGSTLFLLFFDNFLNYSLAEKY